MHKLPNRYLLLFFVTNWIVLAFFFAQVLLVKSAFRGAGGAVEIVVAAALYVIITYLLFLQIVFVIKMRFRKAPAFFFRQAWLLNSLLMPTVIRLGGIFGQSNESVMRSFVEMGNGLNTVSAVVSPERLLVLLPHCIQNSDCKIRVTSNTQSCARCGKCKVGEVLRIAEKYGVNVAVATGGTLARKIIRETRPSVVLAVACERDLVSGLKDVFPLPAFGILNRRPNGPCYNTDLDIEELERQIVKFTGCQLSGVNR